MKPHYEWRAVECPSGHLTSSGGEAPPVQRAVGRRIRQFLRVAACFYLGVLTGTGAAHAAADAPVQTRLRAAVELPNVDLQVGFGFAEAQDWLSEPPVTDPAAELARLRADLRGEPTDAPTLLAIARVTALLEDREATMAAWREAFEAWKRWSESAPGNHSAQLGYARALWGDGQREEAERRLRRLVSEPDATWETRWELATVLGHLAMSVLVRTPDGGPGALFGGARLSAEQAGQASAWLREGLAIAEQLVVAEPENPRGWVCRARLRTGQAMLEYTKGSPEGGLEEGRRMMSGFFPAEALPDLESALKLRPDDPRLVVACLLHRLGTALPELLASAVDGRDAAAASGISSDRQQAVTECLQRLEMIAESPEPWRASEALVCAGIVRILVRGDPAGAGALGQRAFRLNPHNFEAFKLALFGLVAAADRPDWGRLEALVRERLKTRADGTARLMLVRVLHRQGRDADALAEVHDAIKALPQDAALQVAHVALHARLGDWPSSGNEEIPHLKTTRERLEAMPGGKEKSALAVQYQVLVAVLMALDGEVVAARNLVAEAQRKLPDHAYLKEIGSLLAQMPRQPLWTPPACL